MSSTDTETQMAHPSQILDELKYDRKALKSEFTKVTQPLGKGEFYKTTEDELLGELAKSWKEGDKKSWSLKIQNNIKDGPEERSWITYWISMILREGYMKKERLSVKLYYFCGMHYSKQFDTLPDTLAMMRSLLAQLLAKAYTWKDCKPDIGWTLHELESAAKDLPTVVKAFERLCSQLPEGTILHIVLDQLYLYWDENEKKNKKHPLLAMNMIGRILTKNNKVYVKLVVTASESPVFFGIRAGSPFHVDYLNLYNVPKLEARSESSLSEGPVFYKFGDEY